MNESILLIEDEPDLRTTLTDRLQSDGYRVQSTGDGEAGFRQALEGDFDLIVLDVMLPGKMDSTCVATFARLVGSCLF